MRNFKLILPVTLLLLAGITACSFHNVDDDLRPAPKVFCDPNDTATVSFADSIFPIFQKHCTDTAFGDCHYSGASIPKPDYTSYPGIKSVADNGKLVARLINQNPSKMPPSYSNGPQDVSDCHKVMIQKWIAQGAPNN